MGWALTGRSLLRYFAKFAHDEMYKWDSPGEVKAGQWDRHICGKMLIALGA
jgi:hypothetical protein